MNWYQKAIKIAIRFQQLLEDIVQEEQFNDLMENARSKGINKLPAGYDVVQLEDGQWAVLAPKDYPSQPAHERQQIVREENLYKKDDEGNLTPYTDDEAKAYMISSALDRLGFLLAYRRNMFLK